MTVTEQLAAALEALDRGERAEIRSHWLEQHLYSPAPYADVFGALVDLLDFAGSREDNLIRHAEQQMADAGTASGSSEPSVT